MVGLVHSNTMILLCDDFRIDLVNAATQGLITRPIQKSSRNDIFIN